MQDQVLDTGSSSHSSKFISSEEFVNEKSLCQDIWSFKCPPKKFGNRGNLGDGGRKESCSDVLEV